MPSRHRGGKNSQYRAERRVELAQLLLGPARRVALARYGCDRMLGVRRAGMPNLVRDRAMLRKKHRGNDEKPGGGANYQRSNVPYAH